MDYSFKRSEFLRAIFPDIDISDNESVRQVLTVYYSQFGHTPKIEFVDDLVKVSLPDSVQQKYSDDFYKATDLCTRKQYREAIPIFEKIIEKDPQVSEYHRNLGQAYEELGDYQNAIDSLIEALRLNPKNNWALLLMGNIYIRNESDVKTALTYFDQIIEADPENYLALSNIGGAILKAEKFNLAEKFFKRALKVNPDFVNALHGMGIVEMKKGNLLEAFEFGIRGLKVCKPKDAQMKTLVEGFLFNVASQYSKKGNRMDLAADYITELEKLSGKEIRLKTDNTLPVDAKIEIAENYDRDYHLISYRPDSPIMEHLICHELTHLKYILEAREINKNLLFTSNSEEFFRFQKQMEPSAKKLKSDGVSNEVIEGFIQRVFHGLNSRIYNAPIDLFIEDFLFNEYKELRPQQLVSLVVMDKLSLKAVTDPEILKLTPASVISKIKVYNAISARQIDDLFGTDIESKYPLSTPEKIKLDGFWEEYKEYRTDRKPGEEYELVLHWAEDLELDQFFKLKPDDSKTTLGKNPSDFLESIEADPLGTKEIDPNEKEAMRKFIESNSDGKMNMAIFLHMVDAIRFFNKMDHLRIKEIGLELSLLGQTGIDPNKPGYKVSFLKGKGFSGQKVLAYLYVSIALGLPDLLSELKMPYEKEYTLAKLLKNY